MSERTPRALLATALALAALLVVSLSVLVQRGTGDLNFAGRSIARLDGVNRYDAALDPARVRDAARAAIPVAYYLDSDSAARLPRVTEHISRAWAAQTVVVRILQMREMGLLPARREVAGLSEVVRDNPALAALVGEASSVATDTDLGALLAGLREIATSETAGADAALAEAWRER